LTASILEGAMENHEDLSRRDALAKLGKFAAYTAPAMMVLLTSEKAMARSNEDTGIPRDNDPGPNGGGGQDGYKKKGGN
jgi:hypothetical protein